MDWIRGKRLGNGSFATVSIAENKTECSKLPKLMAVKSCGAYQSSSLMKEKLILEKLRDCPEIIQCFGDGYTFENGEKLYNVLLEYAAGGSLSEKVKNSGDHLPEIEVRRYAKALLKGLLYIHRAGYVHCDIKLQNILLSDNGGLKIADFGLAKRVGSKEVGFSKWELRGTPLYMSPETVNGGDLAPPADIWAAGCAVAEMIAGAPAWKYTDLAELLMKIGVGDEVPEIPCCLSEQGRDFLERCFVKDPSKRWTAEMLLSHPFVCGDDQGVGDVLKVNIVSASPRCPFDFVSEVTSSITSLPSPEYSEEPSSWFSDASEFRR